MPEQASVCILEGEHGMNKLRKLHLDLSTLVAALVLAGVAFLIAGCNTVEGMGEDVEATGDSISDTAHDAKD
jgi:predicted small secreted protein